MKYIIIMLLVTSFNGTYSMLAPARQKPSEIPLLEIMRKRWVEQQENRNKYIQEIKNLQKETSKIETIYKTNFSEILNDQRPFESPYKANGAVLVSWNGMKQELIKAKTLLNNIDGKLLWLQKIVTKQ